MNEGQRANFRGVRVGLGGTAAGASSHPKSAPVRFVTFSPLYMLELVLKLEPELALASLMCEGLRTRRRE
jgi:hypothetical protein